MKKIVLGLLSVIFAGQLVYAQPVSDMAVIPMGITIQSVMRLNITKGGNMEFVFKNAADITAGVPAAYGAIYQTSGTITASQSWDLQLTTDETEFIHDGGGTALPLTTVAYHVATTPANSTAAADGNLGAAQPINIITNTGGGTSNRGTNLSFDIQWACGSEDATTIPATAASGRYTTNVILNLIADPTP